MLVALAGSTRFAALAGLGPDVTDPLHSLALRSAFLLVLSPFLRLLLVTFLLVTLMLVRLLVLLSLVMLLMPLLLLPLWLLISLLVGLWFTLTLLWLLALADLPPLLV